MYRRVPRRKQKMHHTTTATTASNSDVTNNVLIGKCCHCSKDLVLTLSSHYDFELTKKRSNLISNDCTSIMKSIISNYKLYTHTLKHEDKLFLHISEAFPYEYVAHIRHC
jgi:hypothetical protein